MTLLENQMIGTLKTALAGINAFENAYATSKEVHLAPLLECRRAIAYQIQLIENQRLRDYKRRIGTRDTA